MRANRQAWQYRPGHWLSVVLLGAVLNVQIAGPVAHELEHGEEPR